MTPAQRSNQCKLACESMLINQAMYDDGWITIQERNTAFAIAEMVRRTVIIDIRMQRNKFIATKKYY